MNGAPTSTLRIAVSGARACFRRPEFTSDLVSYDVMPPTVARQIVRAVAGRDWRVQRISVCKPIRFDEDRLDTARGERRALILVDVAYVLEAAGPFQADRDVSDGAPTAVHLGLADYPGTVSLLDPADCIRSPLVGTGQIDLGWMAYDTTSPRTRFFRAAMIDGTIAVAPTNTLLLAS